MNGSPRQTGTDEPEVEPLIVGDKKAPDPGTGGHHEKNDVELRQNRHTVRQRHNSLSSATWPNDFSPNDSSPATVFLRLKSGSFRDIAQVDIQWPVL